MATKFKAGQAVKQVVAAPITGTVGGFKLDEATGDVAVLVQCEDGSERYFHEDQIEAA